jgi:biofilm PGA synthesis protein PgaA
MRQMLGCGKQSDKRSPALHRSALAIGLMMAMSLPSMAHEVVMPPASRAQELAQAQHERAVGHRVQALAICQDLLAYWPDDAEARHLEVQLLAELGASQRAFELAQNLQIPLSDKEMARLQADLGAHRLRWTRAQPADPAKPFAEADQALGHIQGVVERYRTSQPRISKDASFDALIAQDKGQHYIAALDGYAALQKSKDTLPPYADSAMADALLQRRQPEQAIGLFEAGIKHVPPPYEADETDPRIGLMYAYLEAGRYRDAIALIDRTAASEPVWHKMSGSTELALNPHKAEADLNTALVREYIWLYRDAAQRLGKQLAEAPADGILWRDWGNLQRARGWPRASEDALITSAGVDPSNLSTRLGLIDSWRELNDFSRVEPTLHAVELVQPNDTEVTQVRTEWDHQRGWQFDFEHDRGKGGSPNFGDRDRETTATLMSPLLDDHWRIYGVTRLAAATLDNGDDAGDSGGPIVQRERAGLGVRTYLRGFEGYAQVLTALNNSTRGTAVEAGFRWFPSDHWTFTGEWSNVGDDDTPLRASGQAIVANATDISAEWRASELTSAKFSLNHDRFSDGNHRNGWESEFVQRVYTVPFLTVDSGIQFGKTRNTLIDGPYYSPDGARWAMLTGRLESMLHQRYEREWRQRIDIAYGPYDERQFGTSWTGSIRYGQIFQPHSGMNYGWGLSWSSQPYDGKRDSRVMLDLTMHWGE